MSARGAYGAALVAAVALASGCATAHRGADEGPRQSGAGDVEEGLASYYGRAHQGKLTASGERFDMYAMTAAHRRFPFGAVLRVTDLATGKAVDVTVNDRGPYSGDRIIDLSYAAAKALGMLERGVARVRVERRE